MANGAKTAIVEKMKQLFFAGLDGLIRYASSYEEKDGVLSKKIHVIVQVQARAKKDRKRYPIYILLSPVSNKENSYLVDIDDTQIPPEFIKKEYKPIGVDINVQDKESINNLISGILEEYFKKLKIADDQTEPEKEDSSTDTPSDDSTPSEPDSESDGPDVDTDASSEESSCLEAVTDEDSILSFTVIKNKSSISLVGVKANYSKVQASTNLDYILSSEEFVDSVPEGESSYVVTDDGTEDLDVEQVDSVDYGDSISEFVGTAMQAQADFKKLACYAEDETSEYLSDVCECIDDYCQQLCQAVVDNHETYPDIHPVKPNLEIQEDVESQVDDVIEEFLSGCELIAVNMENEDYYQIIDDMIKELDEQ